MSASAVLHALMASVRDVAESWRRCRSARAAPLSLLLSVSIFSRIYQISWVGPPPAVPDAAARPSSLTACGPTVCGSWHCPLLSSCHRLPSRLRHTSSPAAIDHHCCERLWPPPPLLLWPPSASAGGSHGCTPCPLWQERYRPAAFIYPVARGSSRRPPHSIAPFFPYGSRLPPLTFTLCSD